MSPLVFGKYLLTLGCPHDEVLRMWAAGYPSLLALGCQHTAEGLMVGAVLLELEWHEDDVFHGTQWCDHVQVG